ncbi:hypothetical protein C8R45DRAFT_1216580 [Mycena sanguinolenta]|nr:hypothetical protein C8R45DRAFT_1216580 [Mycena sanguinolenta]
MPNASARRTPGVFAAATRLHESEESRRAGSHASFLVPLGRSRQKSLLSGNKARNGKTAKRGKDTKLKRIYAAAALSAVPSAGQWHPRPYLQFPRVKDRYPLNSPEMSVDELRARIVTLDSEIALQKKLLKKLETDMSLVQR